MDKSTSILKDTTEELLKIIGFDVDIKEESDQNDSTIININASDGGMLIGQGGATLTALQHLIRLIVAKRMQADDVLEQKRFILDINHYRQGRAEALKDLILDKVDQVIRSQRTISLSPMPSYERRIIHLALKGNPNILCQSEGEGEERHIVIKPIEKLT